MPNPQANFTRVCPVCGMPLTFAWSLGKNEVWLCPTNQILVHQSYDAGITDIVPLQSEEIVRATP